MDEKLKSELISWSKSIAIAFLFVFIFHQFIFTPIKVQGESMFPTLEENDKIIVSKLSKINRFDVIVFDAPDAVDLLYVKRVIGIAGDRIEMVDDVLFVNGKEYGELYVNREKQSGKTRRVTGDFTLREVTGSEFVPEGYVFVLGDHRLKSNDSRSFGFVSDKKIVGKVNFRFYPLEEMGFPK
ncbi:signal peptidase I [Sporosarcina siberiensis]|uniref:Signal peptidase I n=1 Tax=Sporosarcina siberiensis TaxID=1365606 RepID=A0ABW4SGX0_9BACL